MIWTSPRRDEVLRAVIAEADRRLDGVLPMDVDGVEKTFRDPATLIDVLHVRWQAGLADHVARALAEEPHDPEAAVVRAWRRTARALPGVRMILDVDVDEASDRRRQALVRRRDRQHRWLATQAGFAADGALTDDQLAAFGRGIETQGRRYYRAGERPSGPPLMKRLKAVLVP